MIKKVFISVVAILICYFAFSQDSTLETTKSGDNSSGLNPEIDLPAEVQGYTKIMVVPFEPKLYMSDVDRDINKKTGLSANHIRRNFRLGITNIVIGEAMHISPVVSMISDDPEIQQDLSYIYKSVGYHAEYMPEEEDKPEETKAREVFNKLKNKTKESIYGTEQGGTSIKDGQLYSVEHRKERFINNKAFNPNMFEYLSKKYEVGYFVFINQLDIKIAPGTDYRQLESEMYQREIKVHYSIYDQQGNPIYASAAKNYFGSVTNDMNRIIKGNFPAIAKEIVFHIPQKIDDEQMKAKVSFDNKQAEKQQKELDSTYR